MIKENVIRKQKCLAKEIRNHVKSYIVKLNFGFSSQQSRIDRIPVKKRKLFVIENMCVFSFHWNST